MCVQASIEYETSHPSSVVHNFKVLLFYVKFTNFASYVRKFAHYVRFSGKLPQCVRTHQNGCLYVSIISLEIYGFYATT